jgi:hypothetical protein
MIILTACIPIFIRSVLSKLRILPGGMAAAKYTGAVGII